MPLIPSLERQRQWISVGSGLAKSTQGVPSKSGSHSEILSQANEQTKPSTQMLTDILRTSLKEFRSNED